MVSIAGGIWVPGQSAIAFWTFVRKDPYVSGTNVETILMIVTILAVSGVIAIGFHGLGLREKLHTSLNALSFGACITFIAIVFISQIVVNDEKINLDQNATNLVYFSIDVMLISFPIAFFLYRRLDKSIVPVSLGMMFLAASDMLYLAGDIQNKHFNIVYTRIIQIPGLMCWLFAVTRPYGKPTKHVTIRGENALTIGVNVVVFVTILFAGINLARMGYVPKSISYSFICLFVVVLVAQLVGHFENKYLQKKQQESIETISKSEEKYQELATHDTLTNLFNRTYFIDTLNKLLDDESIPNNRVAILFVDLDRFKEINDSYGHNVGDHVISEIAERIFNVLDCEDLVCRLGGDEFAVLINSNVSKEHVQKVAKSILSKCTEPITIAGIESYLSCSIGIAFSSEQVNDSQSLLRNADAAMYRAKELGRNRIEFAENHLKPVVGGSTWSLSELRHAVVGDQICVYYQPIIDLSNNKIVGLEALARWKHPTKGIISPNEFIPVAEDNGLIIEIGNSVIMQTLHQLHKWQNEKRIDIENFMMNINLSFRQLSDPDLIQNILKQCRLHDIKPSNIVFEMTESSLLGDVKNAINSINEIHSYGFKVMIDDFGTGYSSLTYLKKFPIDGFKIDKSFVQGFTSDEEDKAIVESLVNLAKAMNLSVTAEGITSIEIRDGLAAMGCTLGQGFLFSQPRSADEIVLPPHKTKIVSSNNNLKTA